jgi:hypothetical protein
MVQQKATPGGGRRDAEKYGAVGAHQEEKVLPN